MLALGLAPSRGKGYMAAGWTRNHGRLATRAVAQRSWREYPVDAGIADCMMRARGQADPAAVRRGLRPGAADGAAAAPHQERRGRQLRHPGSPYRTFDACCDAGHDVNALVAVILCTDRQWRPAIIVGLVQIPARPGCAPLLFLKQHGVRSCVWLQAQLRTNDMAASDHSRSSRFSDLAGRRRRRTGKRPQCCWRERVMRCLDSRRIHFRLGRWR
jgi:hypothetical protein